MSIPRPRLAAVVLAVPILLGVTACQASVSAGSDPTVKAADLSTQVQSQLQEQVPDSQVSCPDDLDGKVGATATCDVTSGEDMFQAGVKVTSVDGTDVKFDLSVDPVLSADSTASQISDQLAKQTGQTPDSVTCPGPLLGVVGTTLTCSLTAGTDTLDVIATVSSVDANSINFDINVPDPSAAG